MNQKNGRTDPGPLRERARSLFISQATIDETLEWATPRQLDAIDRMLATEPANREASKRARLMRQARFPVPKSLDGYDFANVRLPDGYTKEQLTGLDFAAKAQDLVFYGKTGRGKTHLATALGMLAIEQGRSVRFRQTAELVLQPGKAKRDGALDSLLRDLARADLIILDEFTCPSTSTGPVSSTRSSPAATNVAASSSPRTSSSANGGRSSPTTNSPPRSSTASSTTDASSNSPAPADASAKPSCSARRTTSKTNHRPALLMPKTEKN